ncbi:MAG: hypothetical protein ACRD5L_00070, partial [Bryobacteraceae bacterium]
CAEVTTMQGFDPRAQICPTDVLPPGTPATAHSTFEFAAPVMEAVNVWRWPTARVALAGVRLMDAWLMMLTIAEALAAEFALLLAVMVTVFGFGSDAGAV